MKPVSNSAPSPPAVDRRRERREPKKGEELLVLEAQATQTIPARLVDVSSNGFRAAHRYALFESGTLVRFSHSAGSGTARVIWNRSVNGEWESGFLILGAAAPRSTGSR